MKQQNKIIIAITLFTAMMLLRSKTRQGEAKPAASVTEYRDGHLHSQWRLGDSQSVESVSTSKRTSGLQQLLLSAFMPVGWPDAQPPDYTCFVAWHTVQAISSYVRGVLASHAVFKGVGVGSEVSRVWLLQGAKRVGLKVCTGWRAPLTDLSFTWWFVMCAGCHCTWSCVPGTAHPLNASTARSVASNPAGSLRACLCTLTHPPAHICACMQFFVRDILGMAGGIMFAYAAGSNFDSNAKQWRLFADIMNDVGGWRRGRGGGRK